MAQRQRAVRQELATEPYRIDRESGSACYSDCPLHERPAVGVCEITGELTRSGPGLAGDINFVHRSASQFFHQETLPSIHSKDSLLTAAEVRNRVTEAFLGTYTVGCTCMDIVSWFFEKFLSPLRDPAQEPITPEAEEARNMLLRLLLVEDTIDQSQLTTRHTYGWYHRLYLYEGECTSNYSWLSSCCLDLCGVIASLGLYELIESYLKSSPLSSSNHTMGYLLICAMNCERLYRGEDLLCAILQTLNSIEWFLHQSFEWHEPHLLPSSS